MRVLVLAVLLCSLALGDLEHKGESRVYLSEGVGNRLVVHRVRPTCPDDACSQCEAAELVLKLVINKNGTVKQITVTRDSPERHWTPLGSGATGGTRSMAARWSTRP